MSTGNRLGTEKPNQTPWTLRPKPGSSPTSCPRVMETQLRLRHLSGLCWYHSWDQIPRLGTERPCVEPSVALSLSSVLVRCMQSWQQSQHGLCSLVHVCFVNAWAPPCGGMRALHVFVGYRKDARPALRSSFPLPYPPSFSPFGDN